MNNKVIVGLVAGAALGAGLGLLFSSKGAGVREKISEKSDEYLAGLEEKFHEFVAMMTEKFKLAKLQAANMAGIGTNLAKDLAEKGRQRTAEIIAEQEAAGMR